jgi:hypothetical protein
MSRRVKRQWQYRDLQAVYRTSTKRAAEDVLSGNWETPQTHVEDG